MSPHVGCPGLSLNSHHHPLGTRNLAALQEAAVVTAMRAAHILVKPTRTAKAQGQEALPLLAPFLPLLRSRVRVSLTVDRDGEFARLPMCLGMGTPFATGPHNGAFSCRLLCFICLSWDADVPRALEAVVTDLGGVVEAPESALEDGRVVCLLKPGMLRDATGRKLPPIVQPRLCAQRMHNRKRAGVCPTTQPSSLLHPARPPTHDKHIPPPPPAVCWGSSVWHQRVTGLHSQHP